jgi:prepilin-type N-terminal cleavage/methylation domain-containing protein
MMDRSTLGEKSHHSTPTESGFTLIEILVALIVMSILTSSVFYFLGSQNTMGVKSTDMVQGLASGKEKIDSLKVAPFDNLTAGSDTVGDRFIRAWYVSTVLDDIGNPDGRKRIYINVYWPLDAAHSVSLATVVGDPKYKED